MARRILYKDNSLSQSGNPLPGYKFVGYNGLTFSQLDSDGNLIPIAGTGSSGDSFTSLTTGNITITDGASDGYVLTSNSSGVAYWTASVGVSGTSGTSGTSGAAGAAGSSGTSGVGGSQNLSQVLQIGNNTVGQDINLTGDSILTLSGPLTSLRTSGSHLGTRESIVLEAAGDEGIIKRGGTATQSGDFSFWNISTYSSVFNKGRFYFILTPNNLSSGEGVFEMSMFPDLNSGTNKVYNQSYGIHKFEAQIKTRPLTLNNNAPTVYDLLNGTLFYNSSFSGDYVNLPTGTQITQAMPNKNTGDTFEVNVVNTSSSSFTFSAGAETSFPISGQDVIGATSSFKLLFYLNNSNQPYMQIFKL